MAFLISQKTNYALEPYMNTNLNLLVRLILIVIPFLLSHKIEASPLYDSNETKLFVKQMVKAHGGMKIWSESDSLWFQFMTNVRGAKTPFYTQEHVNLRKDNAYITWPLWNAKLSWDGNQIRTVNWPMKGMPPGFFTKLTASFISLPWLTQADDAKLTLMTDSKLPEGDTIYTVVRLEYGRQKPEIPGTYMDIYIDKSTFLMKGIGFNINHPAMMANQKQAIGPNFHVMRDYQVVNGLQIPAYYVSYGKRPDGNFTSNAVHMVFDVRLNKIFDQSQLLTKENTVVDQQTLSWWKSGR